MAPEYEVLKKELERLLKLCTQELQILNEGADEQAVTIQRIKKALGIEEDTVFAVRCYRDDVRRRTDMLSRCTGDAYNFRKAALHLALYLTKEYGLSDIRVEFERMKEESERRVSCNES